MHKNLLRTAYTEKISKDLKTNDAFTIELLIVSGILIASSFLFYILIHFVIPVNDNVIDQTGFLFIRPFISPGLTKIFQMVSFFGTGTFLIPSYLFIIICLLRKNYLRYALMTSTIAISSLLLGWVLKELFHRSRPPFHLVSGAGGYSFPSGHALGGFIFCVILLYLVWKTRKSKSRKCISSILIVVWGLLIGISRIYLHVHYTTDVLGSLFIALSWFSLLYIFFRFFYRHGMHDQQEEKESEFDFIPEEYFLNN